MDNATKISDTIVDQNDNLDALLVSAIGLKTDVGTEVLSTNRQPLTDVLHLLVPPRICWNRYHEALYCGIAGLLALATQTRVPPLPGAILLQSFFLGRERYPLSQDPAEGGRHGWTWCTDRPGSVRQPAPFIGGHLSAPTRPSTATRASC